MKPRCCPAGHAPPGHPPPPSVYLPVQQIIVSHLILLKIREQKRMSAVNYETHRYEAETLFHRCSRSLSLSLHPVTSHTVTEVRLEHMR